MTIAEISRLCEIPAANIRQWLKRGKVKRLPCGSVDLESLVEWVDRDRDMTAYWLIDNAA